MSASLDQSLTPSEGDCPLVYVVASAEHVYVFNSEVF